MSADHEFPTHPARADDVAEILCDAVTDTLLNDHTIAGVLDTGTYNPDTGVVTLEFEDGFDLRIRVDLTRRGVRS